MNKKSKYTEFEVKTVPLEGSNLIEASAGTGKTYSIAILVLRLLLEKGVSIQEILMVTFTNAAVAELEERIRKFIREASRYANEEGKIKDEIIIEIVERAIKAEGKEKVQEKLRSAILYLDETSVMTIHSFCQQSLHEFAFETRQLFNAELVQDTGNLIEEEVQKFWRKYITHIPSDLLKTLMTNNFNQGQIMGLVQAHLDGKDFLFYDDKKNYQIDEKEFQVFEKQIIGLKNQLDSAVDDAIQYVDNHREQITELIDRNTYARNNLSAFVSNSTQLVNKALELHYGGKKFILKLDEFSNHILGIADIQEGQKEIVEDCLNYVYSAAIQEVVRGVNHQKLARNILSFDDLINNLHAAFYERENPALEKELRKKYKAVFIDEFQDTDRLQYEIFEKAFHGESLLFYIGDPKQSIYAWRKADIATYFRAREKVDKVYGMNVNFRSTPEMVEAMNQFFLPDKNFDTFAFDGEEDQIKYIEVEPQKLKSIGNLENNSEVEIPITISRFANNGEVFKALGYQVLELLNNENIKIPDKETKELRRVRPSDIGVLVRSRGAGYDAKRTLSRWGIPSVTVDEAKILQSAEAKDILYVLEAFSSNSRSNLNRAMMTSFIHWTTDKIQMLDEEKLVNNFRKYNEKWRSHGVYSALMDFISDFNVQHNLLSENAENGERIVTNLFHLLEVLYKTESRQHFSPIELIDWLKINIQKDSSTEDEMVQRVESDEDAVRITTIHSSKGLEFPIVITPTLDFRFSGKSDDVKTFRDVDGEYKSARYGQFTDEQQALIKNQEEQENRRLLYVAITRAVYKCIIFKNDYFKTSTFCTFLNVIDIDGKRIEEYSEFINEDHAKRYVPAKQKQSEILKANNFQLRENNWLRMSYSGLAAQNEWKIKEAFESSDNAYDQFIFKDLKKGAQTGNFLHFIFENLDFTKEEHWIYVVDRAIKRFITNPEEELNVKILDLLKHVLQTEIPTDKEAFQLSTVSANNCIHELEFDFPVNLFTPSNLEKLMEEGIVISDRYKTDIEGIMNGKIDLFFEKDGRFYVLDWKSNYLGPNLEDYSGENLHQAMSDSNYHLQYLIYSFAVRKYLKSRLGDQFDYQRDFGGVIYLYLRGMRNGKDSGIFYTKPTEEELNKIGQMLGEMEVV